MIWEAWFILAVVALLLTALTRNWGPPDLLVLGSLAIVVLVGEITGTEQLPHGSQAVSGFANPAVLTVGALFIVVAGLSQTGAMMRFALPLLGRPATISAAQSRIMMPVAALSAFLNNTPIVAMFLPVVGDLCRRTGISPSKLYLPLSCAATLGGLCTLIGTSTNVIVSGLVAAHTQHGPLKFFDPAWVGVPSCLAGLAFIMLTQRWLLPDRKPAISLNDDPREYSVEMTVPPDSPLVGKTIEQAGLRHLPGLYLVEIDRNGDVLAAVGPQERLAAYDGLIFVGVVESLVDLQKLRGLVPALEAHSRPVPNAAARNLMEVVVSDRCPLLGSSIRDGRFRSVYDAAVIAVARSGRRVAGRSGDIVLQPGDTLLLETRTSFVDELRNSPDFYLVSSVQNSAPVRHELAPLAVLILLSMVLAAALEWLQVLSAAMCAAGLMIVTGCCTATEARRNIDWSVLLVIGGSLGIGQALQQSGAAATIAAAMISFAGGNPHLVLAAVYLTTMLFTEMITNNAAAVLVFPIAASAAQTLEISVMPFAMAVMVAASAGFATPIGYQTSLMVYGPGGYRFADYLRFGIPLDLLVMLLCVLLLPLIWPF